MNPAERGDDQNGRQAVSNRGRLPSGRPNPVDVHVGNRVRLKRTLVGLSQEKLGEGLGLTFQQVQKYEQGTNRIGASRLWDISHVLDCPVSYFFEDMDDQTEAASPRNLSTTTTEPEHAEADPIAKRETLELVRAYFKIKDPHVRRRIYELTNSISMLEEELD